MQTQETQGQDPQGLEKVTQLLLSCPAQKPSPRKLQTRRHILPSGDSLLQTHSGDGHTSDLGTAKQCLLYASLRTKGSPGPSSGSAPTWTLWAEPRSGCRQPATPWAGSCLLSDPSQLCLGLRRSLLWVPVQVVLVVAQCSSHLSFVVLSYSSEKKTG